MLKHCLLLFIFFIQPVYAHEHCYKKIDGDDISIDISDLNNLPTLEKQNDSIEFDAHANCLLNAAELRLEKGKHYRVEVVDSDTANWCDGSVITNYLGWDVKWNGNKSTTKDCPPGCSEECKNNENVEGPDVDLGVLKNIYIKLFKFKRRHPDSKLFALMGYAKGKQYSKYFEFKADEPAIEFSPDSDARFFVYANDHGDKYRNNSGKLHIEITYDRDK